MNTNMFKHKLSRVNIDNHSNELKPVIIDIGLSIVMNVTFIMRPQSMPLTLIMLLSGV